MKKVVEINSGFISTTKNKLEGNMYMIKNENEYEQVLARVCEIVDINPDRESKLANELNLLIDAIIKYKEKNDVINPPDPIELIKIVLNKKK